MNKRLDRWTGEFGDAYSERNEITPELIDARMNLFHELFTLMGKVPDNILEIGAGNGQNMMAINGILNMYANLRPKMLPNQVTLHAAEPNETSRDKLKTNCGIVNVTRDSIFNLGYGDGDMELVFTSGVLIHIHPDDLDKAITEMYRVTNKYIFLAEYFAPASEPIRYHGEDGLLWRDDFGGKFLDKFKMRVVGYGFAWKRITKLDNLTWWLLEKTH